MKGIILAGGLGTRLYPLTKITNKHLLPLYDRPMIFFPLAKMADMGIKEVIVVTGGNNAGDFMRLLGDGSQFGLRQLHYIYQPSEGGIAQAIGLCRKYAEGDNILVMLGDNLIEDDLRKCVREFEKGGGYYSWWSPMVDARARNLGWRIDYVLISPALRPRLAKAFIRCQVMGSDHCPVGVELR